MYGWSVEEGDGGNRWFKGLGSGTQRRRGGIVRSEIATGWIEVWAAAGHASRAAFGRRCCVHFRLSDGGDE